MNKKHILTAQFYNRIVTDQDLPSQIEVVDHLDGFDYHMHNTWLTRLQHRAEQEDREFRVKTSYTSIPSRHRYPNIAFEYLYFHQLDEFLKYRERNHNQQFKNFVCSFNGAEHVSRKFLLAAMHVRGWCNPKSVSKNFTWPTEQLCGHIEDYVGNRYNYYKNFFINNDSEQYHTSENPFGGYSRDNPKLKYSSFLYSSICELSDCLNQSFINVVPETIGTSYWPFVTEKFLYSVVTNGLFIAYAQPGWHASVHTHWGFKMFKNIFDYRFDNEENPVVRVIALTDMLSRFEHLTPYEWHDLYLLEKDTLDYNYDHYYSGDFKKCLGVI